jgi:hypothetical protein
MRDDRTPLGKKSCRRFCTVTAQKIIEYFDAVLSQFATIAVYCINSLQEAVS